MNEIYFKVIESKYNEKHLVVFEGGEFGKPIVILNKFDIKSLLDELKEEWKEVFGLE